MRGEDLLSPEGATGELEAELTQVLTADISSLSYVQRRVRKLTLRNAWDDTLDNEMASLELIEWMNKHTPAGVGGRNLVAKAVMDSASASYDKQCDQDVPEALQKAMYTNPNMMGIAHVALALDALDGDWSNSEHIHFDEAQGAPDEEKSKLALAEFALDRSLSYEQARALGVDVDLLDKLRNPEGKSFSLEPEEDTDDEFGMYY